MGLRTAPFLNGLKSGRFKFSLAEQKETTLSEALRKAADFIHAIEICADSSDTPIKAKTPVDRNLGRGDRNHSSGDPRLLLKDVDPAVYCGPSKHPHGSEGLSHTEKAMSHDLGT